MPEKYELDNRLELHELLVGVLGSNNVYFQPPNGTMMRYPAIVYQRSNIETKYADNLQYLQKMAYEITVIDRHPNSEIVFKVAKLPYCRYRRHFTTDGLNHDTFTIIY